MVGGKKCWEPRGEEMEEVRELLRITLLIPLALLLLQTSVFTSQRWKAAKGKSLIKITPSPPVFAGTD